MITYDPKDWLTFIFRFHKADTFRKLFPLMIVISLYAWLIAWLELEHLALPENSRLRNLSLLHNLLGFVLSLLMVFRTNTAYDRWWEGRKAWGALVNASRNLALKMNAILPYEDVHNRAFFKRVIPLYASLLHRHLRAEATRLALDTENHPELKNLDQSRHLPNQVAELMIQHVYQMHRTKALPDMHFLTLTEEIQTFTDVCGICERIKNTPIPFSYSTFIKKFIFFYVMTLPMGFVFSLGYSVIPVVTFVFYVLASLELIAEEIEDPFSGDVNDLPTEQISANIQKHVGEIL